MDTTLIGVMVVGATLAVGGVVLGMIVGYWRGRKRGIKLISSEHSAPKLDALAGVGNAILSAQLKVDALCEVIYQQATRIVDTRNFQIGLFEDNNYVIKVWLKDAIRLPTQSFENKGDDGIVGWIRSNGTGLLVRDFQKEWDTLPVRPSSYTQKPARSAIFAPLISEGTTLGVMAVQSVQTNSFSEEDKRLLTLLANQASAAIRNAQTFEKTQERARQLRLINDVSRQVTAIQPLHNLFHQIVTLIQTAFGYHAVNIFVLDEDTNTFQCKASSHHLLNATRPTITIGQGLVGRAAEQHQTMLAPNPGEDEGLRPVPPFNSAGAEIAVPLKIQDRVIGILNVQSNDPDTFNNNDIFLLESLSGQLAMALQEAETYHTERRQTERLNAMTEVAHAIVSTLDINDILDEVVDLIAENLGYDRVHLFLRSEERLVFRSGSGAYSERWALEKLAYGINSNGVISRVVRTGQTEVNGNVQSDEWHLTGPGVEDTLSEMTVPIRIDTHILGVFDIQSTQPDAFTEDDVMLIQALADTVAIALRNATLFTNESRRRMLSETLRELSTTLASSLDLNSVLRGILAGLERVVPYTCGMILLLNREEELYEINTAQGDIVPPEAEVWDKTIPAAKITPARLIDLLHRINAYPDQIHDQPHDEIVVPLIMGDDTIGYLVMEHVGTDQFSTEDNEIIKTFASQASVAITNAQLYMAQQEEAWVSTALLQVAEAVSTQLDAEQSLETIVRLTPLLVGIERCGVIRWHMREGHFIGGPSWGLATDKKNLFSNITFSEENGRFLLSLVESHQPTSCGVGTDYLLPELLQTLFESPTLLGLPLIARGHLVGIMLVDHPAWGGQLDHRRHNILSGIAHQTALALENASLQADASATEQLERELEVARDIQTSFLPNTYPAEPGWDIATCYRAAHQVGGDFYDFFPIDAHRWALVVADVADKGVPAALFMALSRTLLRAVGTDAKNPANTLVRVNDLLLRDSHSDLFVTIWYGLWDASTGQIHYSSAGHNPPLIIRSDGNIEALNAGGIALGIVPSIKLHEAVVTLNPGDLLVAYTDGITEAIRSDYTEFGVVGLQSTLARLHKENAQHIAQEVLKALDNFVADEPQFDDITMIVLKSLSSADQPIPATEDNGSQST